MCVIFVEDVPMGCKTILTSCKVGPTSYKWSCNPYKWPYAWVTGVITPTSGVFTLPITGRAPPAVEPFFVSTKKSAWFQTWEF